MPAARLTQDKTEARTDWWISSRAYFDGGISQAERVPRHLNRQNIIYKRIPYKEQPPSVVLPKKRGNKTKNNVKKSNLSPLNLGNALDDDIEGDDDVMFLGAQFTVPFTFWKQLVPHLCMPDIDSNTPVGWLSREHINSWMELLIRNSPKMPCGQWPIRLQ
uniref:Uncharacterized protein n=1 Tax=Tanacetum cinerariifolium TaxID=118510 RepID=A0A699IP40_TANCI|nr:hypothetical protein [Tanacetum cinerariifolium]